LLGDIDVKSSATTVVSVSGCIKLQGDLILEETSTQLGIRQSRAIVSSNCIEGDFASVHVVAAKCLTASDIATSHQQSQLVVEFNLITDCPSSAFRKALTGTIAFLIVVFAV
jgi:hypothetical protein